MSFIFIDRSKKLRARLEQSGSDIFEDADFKTSIVHIGEDKDDNYLLVILFEARQTLKKEFKTPFGSFENIEMKTIYELNLHYDNREKKIHVIGGRWFDINNVIFKIVVENGTESEQLRISNELCSGVDPFTGRVDMKFVGYRRKPAA